MNQRFAPTHTPEFHAVLERMKIIGRVFEGEVSYDELSERAQKVGLSKREAELESQLLTEACGCIIAEELGIELAENIVLEIAGEKTEVRPEDLDGFRAAYFLAYNLRHGGRNDHFTKFAVHSSLNDTLHNFLDSDPGNKIEDLRGAKFSLHIWVD